MRAPDRKQPLLSPPPSAPSRAASIWSVSPETQLQTALLPSAASHRPLGAPHLSAAPLAARCCPWRPGRTNSSCSVAPSRAHGCLQQTRNARQQVSAARPPCRAASIWSVSPEAQLQTTRLPSAALHRPLRRRASPPAARCCLWPSAWPHLLLQASRRTRLFTAHSKLGPRREHLERLA